MEWRGTLWSLMASTRTTCPLIVPQQGSNITLGVSMRTSYSWQDKHLTHHITYTWLMTVPQSEGSPHTHEKSLPRPLPSLLHIWGNAARWKQEGRKSLRNKQILRQVPPFSTRHLGVASASVSREEDFVHSGRLRPNRIKSGNSTQWFPNALCVLKVPESYLGFSLLHGHPSTRWHANRD